MRYKYGVDYMNMFRMITRNNVDMYFILGTWCK